MEEIEKKERHFFRTLFFTLLLIIILIIIYGMFLGNKGLVSKEYTIKNSNLPRSFDNLKIVHFSDILYKNSYSMDFFDDIVKKVNAKKPDIIIFTGNLTNGKYKFNGTETKEIITKLSKLSSTYGKYYVNGNEDKNNPSYESIMQNSGFLSLNDNKDIIYSKTNDKLLLVGIDNNSPAEFIKDIVNDSTIKYKIAIFSESDEMDEIKDYNFDLAFASNSLNGQINIPYIKEFFTREGSKKYIDPYYEVNNTKLYISSGIGTDKFDYRIFNRPSFNLYRLQK